MNKKCYKIILVRMICVLLAAMFLSNMFAGDGSSRDNHGESSFKYASFREVPGITDDEIKDIEALQGKVGHFNFGTLMSTESFLAENVKIS